MHHVYDTYKNRLQAKEYIMGKIHRFSLQVGGNPDRSPASCWHVVIHLWGMKPPWFLCR